MNDYMKLVVSENSHLKFTSFIFTHTYRERERELMELNVDIANMYKA